MNISANLYNLSTFKIIKGRYYTYRLKRAKKSAKLFIITDNLTDLNINYIQSDLLDIFENTSLAPTPRSLFSAKAEFKTYLRCNAYKCFGIIRGLLLVLHNINVFTSIDKPFVFNISDNCLYFYNIFRDYKYYHSSMINKNCSDYLLKKLISKIKLKNRHIKEKYYEKCYLKRMASKMGYKTNDLPLIKKMVKKENEKKKRYYRRIQKNQYYKCCHEFSKKCRHIIKYFIKLGVSINSEKHNIRLICRCKYHVIFARHDFSLYILERNGTPYNREPNLEYNGEPSSIYYTESKIINNSMRNLVFEHRLKSSKKILGKKYMVISRSRVNGTVTLLHKTCSTIYTTQLFQILKGHGRCPYCSSSLGERCTAKYLTKHHFTYIHSYIPKWLHGLHLDFYLPKLNIGIEYDGSQHFKPVKIWGGIKGLKHRKYRDKKKDELCHEHHTRLIRIESYIDSNKTKTYKLVRNTLNFKL